MMLSSRRNFIIFSTKFVKYCTSTVEYKQQKDDIQHSVKHRVRPFSKDILQNRFNLELFEYPDIRSEELEKAQKLVQQLKDLFKSNYSTDGFSDVNFEQLSKSGIYGLHLPATQNGANYSNLMLGLVHEVLSNNVGFMLNDYLPQMLAIRSVWIGGSDTMKQGYLFPFMFGGKRATVCINDSLTSLSSNRVTAFYDVSDDSYILNGTVSNVLGLDLADTCIVLARENDQNLMGFLVDKRSYGLSIHSPKKSGDIDSLHASIDFDSVKVPKANILPECNGAELGRKIISINDISISVTASTLLRSLLEITNNFVNTTNVFGKRLDKFETVQHELVNLTMDAYAAESIAYFSTGLLDNLPNNDMSVECGIAKIFCLEAMWRSLGLSMKLMGTRALSCGDRNNGKFLKVYNDINLLYFNQPSTLSLRQTVTKECLDHAVSEIKSRRMSFSERLARLFGMLNIKGVMGDGITVNSFKYNLHPRIAVNTDRLYKKLYQMMKFVENVSRRQQIPYEDNDFLLIKLSDILVDVYSLISVLSRASRSISVGLRNSDLEVKLANSYIDLVTERVEKVVEELKNHEAIVKKSTICAKYLQQIDGSLNSFQIEIEKSS